MKAREWHRFLEEQRRRHDKVLFAVTELAHIANTSRAALNVELTRLRRQGIIMRYAHGQYGLPDAVTPELLLPVMDSHAYITGSYALYVHNLITQAPTRITCFTDRRSPRAQVRNTPVGRFVFVCVRSRVYAPPAAGVLASPEQALYDFVYILRRQGLAVLGQVTLRNLEKLEPAECLRIGAHYPATVRTEVGALTPGYPP